MGKKRKKFKKSKNKKTDWQFWLNIFQTGLSAIQTAITIYNSLIK